MRAPIDRFAAVAVLAILLPAVAAAVSSRPAQDPEQETGGQEEVVLGRGSAIRTFDQTAEQVLVEEGTRLYSLPDARSQPVAIVAVTAPREVLERAGGWVMLRIEGQGGWAAIANGRAGPEVTAPPAPGHAMERQEPIHPAEERLARALEILDRRGGAGATSTTRRTPREADRFTLYTDVADPRFVDFLADLTKRLPAEYEARYGLRLWDRDRFALVVFEREKDYRAFESIDAELIELDTGGHVRDGVAAIFAGGRKRVDVAPILLHEITHLLNKSAFRLNVPAWLDEGMAEDLAYSRVEPSGELDTSTLAEISRTVRSSGVRERVIERRGPALALADLVAATGAGETLSLAELMSMTWLEMVQVDGRAVRYAQSAFLVRFLLDGAEAGQAASLKDFLHRVAEGGRSAPEDFLGSLETDWASLSGHYERWLSTLSKRLGGGARP